MRDVFLLVALCAAAPAAAQSSYHTIDPGMTRDEVVERFGIPAGERMADPFTFLFYEADCPGGCAVEDVVVLEDTAVVDALLLGPYRVYTGKSSLERSELAAPVADDPLDDPYDIPWSTFSATPLLPTGQPGIAHGRDEALNTPPGIPAGTTTVAAFSVPAPGTPVPEGVWIAPFAGAAPAPEDAARIVHLRQNWIIRQFLDELQPESPSEP